MHPIFDGVKAVFIDVDDTLLDFSKCTAVALEKACAEHNVPFAEHFTETFLPINVNFWKKIETGELTREQVFTVRFDTVFAALGLSPAVSAAAFDDTFRAHLNDVAVPVDGAEALLAALSARFPVYAASNAMYDQQQKRLAKSGLRDHFTDLFISDVLGAEKPRKAYFDACFAKLPGVLPCHVVMIGDSVSADIAGAKQYGLRTIWFNHAMKKLPSECADITVGALKEITDMITDG